MSEGRELGVIPARGGSKGVPRKNIKAINGRPLICWTIQRALASRLLAHVFVSTDDPEIAEISRECGLEVPFLRPGHLATDQAPTADTVLHALEELEKRHERFEYVALLEPTSPLRKATDIDDAIRQIRSEKGADSLISVGEVHTEHPMLVKRVKQGFLTPYTEGLGTIHQRQQADEALFPYGVIYISRVSVFREVQSFYSDRSVPFRIERWQNYEIDDELDFSITELLMRRFMGDTDG